MENNVQFRCTGMWKTHKRSYLGACSSTNLGASTAWVPISIALHRLWSTPEIPKVCWYPSLTGSSFPSITIVGYFYLSAQSFMTFMRFFFVNPWTAHRHLHLKSSKIGAYRVIAVYVTYAAIFRYFDPEMKRKPKLFYENHTQKSV